ncbi:MAG TPA: MMPL family transporter [Actinocrinis sp.]|nr:MMPL family transporter [Actinocrinis sp.]
MSAIARWCFQRRYLVMLMWVVGLVGLGAAGNALGTNYSNSFSLPGTESTKALTLLQSQFASQSGDQDTVVWHVNQGSVRDPQVQDSMTSTLAAIAKLPEVAAVRSPYDAQGAIQISKDGSTAYAQVNFTMQGNLLDASDVTKVITTAQAAGTSNLEVELTGNAIDQVAQAKPSASEGLGILAAGVVLFIAFGALFAMLLPILTAVFGLGAGILAVDLLTHTFSIAQLAPTLSALIGLGVGIDYALFIVTRYRRGLQRGLEPIDSVAVALNTSGRAVLFAGGTVCIALLGMLVLGVSFLNGVAIAAALTVLFTVLSAITLLPAMLGVLGVRVLSRRQRRKLAERGPEPADIGGFWARWAGFVQRRPKILAVAALAVLVVLAIPVGALRLGHADDGNAPTSSTSRKAYDLLADGFGPGFNGPLELVVQFGAPTDAAHLPALVSALRSTPDVAAVQSAPVKAGATLGIIEVYPSSAPDAVATTDLISDLRTNVIPQARAGTSETVYVTGATAIFYDFANVLDAKLPLFIGVIIGLGFLLLLLAFRSIGVPMMAAVMNLLGAAASFGVLTAVFQWGWGLNALGLGTSAPIEAFLPVMMLSILFGLSMDYQVFLVSRMHEEWVHTGDNKRAVRIGQAETGRVITAAATIMICVFLAFVFGGQRVIAEFGIGLASAVAIDAFLIRTILVPASMQLLGRANWWLPGWLDRVLPHLSVDPADDPAEPGAAGSAAEPISPVGLPDPDEDDLTQAPPAVGSGSR